MKLFNTLGRAIEEVKPLENKTIAMYTCGPTVYHYMHIGNLRKIVFDDLIKRTLIACGFEVKHVMNITDVGHLASDGDGGEDKLEKEARIEKKSVWDIAKYYTQHALADYASVNVLKPTKTLRATDCIDSQIDFIKKLQEKGFAYEGELAVYFDTAKVKDYGKLAGQNQTEKQVAVREGLVVDKTKRNVQDFALWIFTKGKHKDHAMRWKSPWGEGFPGWHIECSSIIRHELGETIDIHTGGVDLIGTHHTNEIAQSEALNAKPLSRFWVHSEFLLVNGEKMAKSLGNTYRIVDLEERGFNPLAFRLLIMQSHYRSQQNFTWQALKDAQNQLNNLQAVADLRYQTIEDDDKKIDFEKPKKAILDALKNDLNSPEALAAVNRFFDELADSGIDKKSQRSFVELLKLMDELLGLNFLASEDITKDQKHTLEKREGAREKQNWVESDKLRKQLEAKGIGINDTASGPVWYRL